jgi:hypothetical protein
MRGTLRRFQSLKRTGAARAMREATLEAEEVDGDQRGGRETVEGERGRRRRRGRKKIGRMRMTMRTRLRMRMTTRTRMRMSEDDDEDQDDDSPGTGTTTTAGEMGTLRDPGHLGWRIGAGPICIRKEILFTHRC